MSSGTWSNNPTGFTYARQDCDSTGSNCASVGAADIPPASQPTATGLLATPGAPVTNQTVTLIATVTAGTSSTALWGTVMFENGGAAIAGFGKHAGSA